MRISDWSSDVCSSDLLFGAAMEEADVRIDPLDDLSVHFQHHAQHAMRGRVLRAEVHHIIGDIDLTRLRGDEFIQCIGHYFLPSASTGDGAPGASGCAFSSPGSTYFAPSQGLRKSKLRKSCASFTGA